MSSVLSLIRLAERLDHVQTAVEASARVVVHCRRMMRDRARHWELARLLLAARPYGPGFEARVQARVTEGHTEAAIELLGHFRTTYRAAQNAAAAGIEVPKLMSRATAEARSLKVPTAVQLLTTRQLQRSLKAEGISSAVMKGPSLAERLHGVAEGRGSSADIDLLVAPEDLDNARRHIERLGWRAPDDLVDAEGRPIMHFHLDAPRPGISSVDLHWRAHWFDGSASFSKGIIARATEHDGLIVPDRIDDLVILLTSFARDGFTGLRTAADIAAWWEGAEAAGVTDTDVGLRCSAYPELWEALIVASAVAAAVVETPELAGRRGATSRLVARTIFRLTREPRGPKFELAKRTVVDAVVAPHRLRERWPAVWLPRRARVVRPAAILGHAVHQALVGREDG